MSPSIFLGVDKSLSPTSVHNQLRKKREVVAKHVDSSQLKKFDILLQKPLSWDALFNWGDNNKIWIGSREDFQEYNPVSESRVDKSGHMKLSPKQQKIAAMAGNRKKIDAPDFAALRAMHKHSKKTESRAEQVVNRLVGENVMDLLAAAGSGIASELDTDGDGRMDMHAHKETDMSNPEERKEVDIANDILMALDDEDEDTSMEELHAKIRELAHELLDMHGQSEESDKESDEESNEGPSGEASEGKGEGIDDEFEEVR